MLTKTQLERYADVLLWGLRTARTKKYTKDDNILIRYDLAAIKLAEILQARILALGMNPILRMGSSPVMDRNFFERANDRQLKFQPPGEKELYENLNGSIFLHAPESITHLRHIDPTRIGSPCAIYCGREKIRAPLDGPCACCPPRSLRNRQGFQ
jgi:aminopeptidase